MSMMRRKRTTRKPLEELSNAKRAFVTLSGWEAGLVPLQEVRREMLRLAVKLDRAQQRLAELEPLADARRKVEDSRNTASQLAQRKAQYLAVFECAVDVLKDGRGHRGLAQRVYDRYRKKLKLSERQIRRILREIERMIEDASANA